RSEDGQHRALQRIARRHAVSGRVVQRHRRPLVSRRGAQGGRRADDQGAVGLGFTLGEVWRATKDETYHKAALRTVKILNDRAAAVGKGVQWSNTTDIISGTAGIGLYLLYADEVLKDPTARALAIRAGNRLLEQGTPEHGGLK